MYSTDTTNTSVLHYWYPLEDIAKDVEMRTSYLGKYRRTQDSAHMLDIVAFTKDERDLFISFYKSAASLIFPMLSKLTKNLTDAYKVLEETTGNYANSIHYKIEWTGNMNPNYKSPLDQRIEDCICWYIIWRWLSYTMPNIDDQTAATGYASALQDIKDYTSRRLQPYVFKTPRVF